MNNKCLQRKSITQQFLFLNANWPCSKTLQFRQILKALGDSCHSFTLTITKPLSSQFMTYSGCYGSQATVGLSQPAENVAFGCGQVYYRSIISHMRFLHVSTSGDITLTYFLETYLNLNHKNYLLNRNPNHNLNLILT